ncbi:hypothetical protein KC951_00490 [Candidatus Saccharibacteria bacterium]|nr:hypothetical protein [Candidatus Saccharibacteria bacterium]
MPERQDTFFDVETWYEGSDKTIALIVLKGLGSYVRNNESETTYEVVSGLATFEFEDEPGKQFFVEAGNKVTVPMGIAYRDQGDVVMLATSTPPFNPNAVEIIQDNIQ